MRVISCVSAVAIMLTSVISVHAAESNLQRIPSNGVTFKKKAGYWTECRYTGLGTVCETVYSRAKNGKFKAVTVANSKFKKRAGEYQVCYWGSNNAEICYWVYSPRMKR
jgi:hypothetical protein